METVATLLLVGTLLLLLETVLPGMIAGVIGLLCLIAGVVIGYRNFGFHTGNTILFIVMTGLIVGTVLWMKYFPGSRMGRAIISNTSGGDVGAERPELLNQTGTAITQLRPCGTALINGERVDVVSEGMMIGRGQALKVVAVEGMRVVVRAA